MYLNFYNLNTKPFQISTDPRFLWLGEKHKEALAVLRYGILDNKGFLLLTGEVGTGKTTLIHALINALQDDVILANVPDPGLETMEFYAYIARAFHLNNGFKTKYEFLSMFGDFLHQTHAEKKHVLLIIDESQRIDQALLEEIRLLSNIEKQSTKLINIFFVGQTEFNSIILEDRNSALRQRITVNYDLGPISRKETSQYVQHRLKVAGTDKRIFTSGAIKEVHAFSEGYPRLINVICDRALLTGYANGSRTISGRVIRECADEMRLHKKGRQKKMAAEALRGKNQQSKRLAGRQDRRSVKPGLYVLLGVLIATWVGIAAYVYSPKSMQQLIMIFKGRLMKTSSVEKQPAAPVEQLKPETNVQAEEKQTQKVNPEPMQPENNQLVLDRKAALSVALDNQGDLTDEAYATLDKLAVVMSNDLSLFITIKGYSRGFGNIKYNKKMSEFNANIIKGYLVGKGIKPERIKTMGLLAPDSKEGSQAPKGKEVARWVEILLNAKE